MADLLRKGYTMLNYACPSCKNPIFKSKSGEMFCPACNKPVIFAKEDKNTSNINLSGIKGVLKDNELIDNTVILNFINDVILKKLKLIADNFNREIELGVFDNYLGLIQKLLEILQQIQDLRD